MHKTPLIHNIDLSKYFIRDRNNYDHILFCIMNANNK
jgi:hypothetical protein